MFEISIQEIFEISIHKIFEISIQEIIYFVKFSGKNLIFWSQIRHFYNYYAYFSWIGCRPHVVLYN